MTTTLRTLFSATLALASLTVSAVPALAGDEPGYSHDAITLWPMPNWMSLLPDSLKLSYMSIPGTHDSMAMVGGDSVQTQSMDLYTQLLSGIRVLDIRIHFENNTFNLSHGIVPQPGNFDSVLQTVATFLKSEPKETVLMRVRDENDGSGNTLSFEQVFDGYWRTYSSLFWQNPKYETNPTLGEVRGKVVVLQNFDAAFTYGIGYGNLNAQDNYQLNTNWDLYNKWTDVKNQLAIANLVGSICAGGTCVPLDSGNENRVYINYLSGSGGVFPYFVASGKSDPSTGGPLLATGETTPLFNNWPDFPRNNCFLGMCTIDFEGTNNLAYQWLAGIAHKRVGIIMADFPGSGLITQVVALNKTAAAGF